MHELSVTENILNIACEHAVKANAKNVTDIYLVIGQLSSIIDESVQFYWDIISKGSVCENAILHFRRIAASLECLDCHHEYLLEGELTPCPSCNSANVRFLTGNEFYMESIDITITH
jgi:hydrogenase nickel incorporation protein HypA/HybF